MPHFGTERGILGSAGRWVDFCFLFPIVFFFPFSYHFFPVFLSFFFFFLYFFLFFFPFFLFKDFVFFVFLIFLTHRQMFDLTFWVIFGKASYFFGGDS